LLQSLKNPAASSCADEVLLRVLKTYDQKKDDHVFVETIAEGKLFKTHDGKIFKKGERMRKRFKCVEIATKKLYLFSPVYEVIPIAS
jgi:SprT protein